MQHLSDPTWLDYCDTLIRRELSRRGWTLADDPELFGPGQSFRANVLARIAEWATQEARPLDDKLIVDAVKNEYSRLLQRAIGLDGSRVQNTALSEAMRYAWPKALHVCSNPEQAETAILRAATQAWLHIDRCYPGCFLAWFTKIVLNETKVVAKKQRRTSDHEIAETDLPGVDNGEPQGDRNPLDVMLALAEKVGEAAGDLHKAEVLATRSWLIDKLRACLKNARREFILIAQFFLELNASEIARQLAVSVQVVFTEKHRALAHIRKCCADLRAELQAIVNV